MLKAGFALFSNINVELNHKAHIYVAKYGKEEFIHLNYGAVTVALPEYPDIWYTLVIVN